MVKNFVRAIFLMTLALSLAACGSSSSVRMSEAQVSSKHVRSIGEESGCTGGGTVIEHTAESQSWYNHEQRENRNYRGYYSVEEYRNIGLSRRARIVEDCLKKPTKSRDATSEKGKKK